MHDDTDQRHDIEQDDRAERLIPADEIGKEYDLAHGGHVRLEGWEPAHGTTPETVRIRMLNSVDRECTILAAPYWLLLKHSGLVRSGDPHAQTLCLDAPTD